MLKPVSRWISGIAVVLGVVAIAGCAPRVEEEPVIEVPPPEMFQPFAGIESFSDLDDEGRQALADLRGLIRTSGEVEIPIQGPEDGEPDVCNRVLDDQVLHGYIRGGNQATWRIYQEEPGLWMEGDSVYIERKRHQPDRCFDDEPFSLRYPDLEVVSGYPSKACLPIGPLPPLRHYWDYWVELRNDACISEEQPNGTVSRIDPVVIIEPGGPFG